MKKLLAIVLMMAVLVCPVLASGEASGDASAEPAATAAEPAAATAAEPAAELDAAGAPHYELQVIQEPTCTENGVSAYVDESTGAVLFTFETAATGHVPSAGAATCTESVVCTVCGETLEPASGHAYTYQYDAVQNEDGSFASFGTWKCDNCGDVVNATEGNAVYYYGVTTPAAEPEASAEAADEASAEASDEASATEAEAAAVGNPDYDPDSYNWASIEIVLALVIVVLGAVLMLSFGKKKNG